MLYKFTNDGKLEQSHLTNSNSSFVISAAAAEYAGLVPASASQVMQLRLETANSAGGKNKRVYDRDDAGSLFPHPDSCGKNTGDFLMHRDIDILDGVAIHNKGIHTDKLKYVYGDTNLWIPLMGTRYFQEMGFEESDIILTDKEYNELDGPEFDYSELAGKWGVDKTPITKQWAKQHPLWLAAAKGDKHLLSEYVDLAYAEMQRYHNNVSENGLIPEIKFPEGYTPKWGFGVNLFLEPHYIKDWGDVEPRAKLPWMDDVFLHTFNRARLGLEYTLTHLTMEGFTLFNLRKGNPLATPDYGGLPVLVIALPPEKAASLDSMLHRG